MEVVRLATLALAVLALCPVAVAQVDADSELRVGTSFTSQGRFSEAIPHLLAARGHVSNEYAAGFNLALCYVATGRPQQAISILNELRAGGDDNADVNNLLAQAYIGAGQDDDAFKAIQRAVSLTPSNEKLYMFIADACMDKQNYTLGLKVAELGLKNVPNSPQLHFERGMFFSLLDRFDDARHDFELARKLSPDSEISYIAGTQEALFEGEVAEATRIAREAIGKGHHNFLLLTLFGEALLGSGVAPGEKDFEEARRALETAASERPNYPSSHLALGKLYLLEGRSADAVSRLELARNLSPNNPAVYSQLAAAYRKQGEMQKAQDALATLARLNQAQAEKIRSAPGERKASYGDSAPPTQ